MYVEHRQTDASVLENDNDTEELLLFGKPAAFAPNNDSRADMQRVC